MTTQSRQPILRCVPSNAAHPEYDQVTVPFPTPVTEYECTLGCLAAVELGARLKQDYRVDELESGFPIPKRLEKVDANLDELDYPTRQLGSFDDYKAAQFQAIMVRLGTPGTMDFINPTFYYQRATVTTNFSDLGGIGKTYILTISGGCLCVDEQEQVDGRTEALKLIPNEHDTVTPYRVVYDNGIELERLYTKGGPLSGYLDRKFVILLEASSGEGQSTLLILLDSLARLERLPCRTGIRDSPQVYSRITGNTLPDEVIRSISAERLSTNGLNRPYRVAERIVLEDLKTLAQLLTNKNQPNQGPSLGGLFI